MLLSVHICNNNIYVNAWITLCSNLWLCLRLFTMQKILSVHWPELSPRLNLLSSLIGNVTLCHCTKTKKWFCILNSGKKEHHNIKYQRRTKWNYPKILSLNTIASTERQIQNKDKCFVIVCNVPQTEILSYFKQCRQYVFTVGSSVLSYRGLLLRVCFAFQVIRKGEVSCCWICTACKENEFVQDEFTCKACELGWWPNAELTGREVSLKMRSLLTGYNKNGVYWRVRY